MAGAGERSERETGDHPMVFRACRKVTRCIQEAEEQYFEQFTAMLEQNSTLERELHHYKDLMKKEQISEKTSLETFMKDSSEILISTELGLNSICDCLELLGEKFATLGYDRTLMMSALGKLTGLQVKREGKLARSAF
eukprot:188463-Hanusia_phi.AAC.3